MICLLVASSTLAQPHRPGMHTTWLRAMCLHAEWEEALITADFPACIKQNFRAGSYIEKKFGLPDLVFIRGSVSFGWAAQGVAMAFSQLGHPLYKAWDASLSYSRDLGTCSAGIQFRLSGQRFPGVRDSPEAGYAVSLRLFLSNILSAAIAVSDPDWLRIGRAAGPAGSARILVDYHCSPLVSVSTECWQEWGRGPGLACSLLYRPVAGFYGRIGISAPGPSWLFAAAWRKQGLMLVLAFTWHPLLGISPGLVVAGSGSPQAEKP